MTTQDITEIKHLLATPKKVVIVTHKNPDGDAIGSTLGLLRYLIQLKHEAIVIIPNACPDFLKWLPKQGEVMVYENEQTACDTLINNAELIFTLDFNAFHRAGHMENVLTNSTAIKIMIDHHQQPDGYANYMYSDVSMSSTCEMVYHFLDKLQALHLINESIATPLYTGIMTDTGSFRFACTTSTTHTVIANLITKGANNAQIHNDVFNTNSYNRLQLLGCALNNLTVIEDMRTAYITLSYAQLCKYNFQKGDTEGFVNYGLSLKNIVLAAIFIEDKQQNIIKISLRSKGDFSVNLMSRAHFEGGGHTNAAGGKSNLSLQKTVDKFISILPQYKEALSNA